MWGALLPDSLLHFVKWGPAASLTKLLTCPVRLERPYIFSTWPGDCFYWRSRGHFCPLDGWRWCYWLQSVSQAGPAKWSRSSIFDHQSEVVSACHLAPALNCAAYYYCSKTLLLPPKAAFRFPRQGLQQMGGYSATKMVHITTDWEDIIRWRDNHSKGLSALDLSLSRSLLVIHIGLESLHLELALTYVCLVLVCNNPHWLICLTNQ